MSTKTPVFTFETALAELEQLVQRMESGELSLEESLQSFEQGVKLTRQCQQALSSAEQRVQLLLQQNGQSVAQPFQGEQRCWPAVCRWCNSALPGSCSSIYRHCNRLTRVWLKPCNTAF